MPIQPPKTESQIYLAALGDLAETDLGRAALERFEAPE